MAKQKPFVAVFLILKKGNQTLLLRRCNTGFEDGNYSLISGHLEENETCTQALVREAQEEAGIIINQKDLELIYVNHRNSADEKKYVDIFMFTPTWNGEITNKEPERCDDLSWFDIDKLPQNIIPFVKQAIENANHKKTYGESGW